MAVYKRKGSDIFWVEFVAGGRRYRRSAGTTLRRKAEEFERQLRQQVYDEVTLGRRKHEPMRFEDAVTRYVSTHLKTKKRLDSTAKSDAYLLARLTALIGANTLLDQIDEVVIADLKTTVFDSGRKEPSTVNKYLAALRAICRMAHFEWKRMRHLPRFKLYALHNERTRWLRPEEEVRLLRACEAVPHLHDLVVFLVDTGLRRGEACRLTWDNVELPKRGTGVVRAFATKTQKWRSIYLTNRADALMRRLHADRPADQERVFLIRTVGCAWRGTVPQRKPFTNPHGAWRHAVKVAELHDLRIHDLRHTFASRLVQRGVPLLDVAELLGHSSIKMTMRYAHLASGNLKIAIAKLN